MTVVANAVLVMIAQSGGIDGSGDPTGPETVWAGRAAGYLKRARRTVVSGGVEVPVRRDTFTILRSAGAPALEVAGPDWEASTVTIEDHRDSTTVLRVFTVNAMENRAADTVADSIRLELDQERAIA